MISKLATLLAYTAASASAASLSAGSSLSRRADDDEACRICFRLCPNGVRKFPRLWECQCNPGFTGACCNDCDSEPVKTVDIELDEWVRATWYVQKQQVNGYQPANSLYCVAATYSLENTTVPFFDGTVIDVNNYGNRGGINREVTGGVDNGILCGRVSDEPGKLSVAPCFLPNIAAGPYWIAGVGTDAEGRYTWAVVVGGQPTDFGPDGKCTTKRTGMNNSGLWFFSRTPEAPAEEIAEMEQVLEAQGISSGFLIDVPQKGCNYEGALIKGNN